MSRLATLPLLLSLCVPAAARAQQPNEPAQSQPAAQPQQAPAAQAVGEAVQGQAPAPAAKDAKDAPFSPEQLEQIVAPIALYADSLVAHVLMASTYPLEVVSAARWRQKNSKLTGDALEKALQSQTWDPSVKSLCTFPDVLARMNENLDWMKDLGDAFLGQQAELMDAVQRMRHKAKEAGTLESGKEQTITQEGDTIIIQPADPEVIYVPTYYPSSVYGGWGYPYWYYPPMYAPPPAGGLWFGFSVGVIWGAAWGDCDWGHDEVNIDIDNQNNFIDRTERPEQREKVKERANGGASARDKAGNRSSFKHDASHRKGAGYRDTATAQRYGDRAGQSRVSRDQARGYGDRASTRPSTGGPASSRDGARAGTSDRAGSSDRSASRGASASDRSSNRSTGERSGSFSGSRNSGMERAGSSRGAQSRGSAGSRGGGGGGRRGGGGGRGGRR